MTVKNFIATNTITEYLRDIRQLKEEIKRLQEIEKYLKEEIANLIGDSDAICNEEGTLLATYKYQERLIFNTTQFKKVNPEIYDEFCKVNLTRTFIFKE